MSAWWPLRTQIVGCLARPPRPLKNSLFPPPTIIPHHPCVPRPHCQCIIPLGGGALCVICASLFQVQTRMEGRMKTEEENPLEFGRHGSAEPTDGMFDAVAVAP